MRVFAIMAGTLAVLCAFIAQANGWNEGSPNLVYHHLWWASAGGFILAGGIFNE